MSIIEEVMFDWQGLDLLFVQYFKTFKKEKIEALILGCTHYGLIEKKIAKFFDHKVKIISQGKIIGEKLKNYLERHQEISLNLGKNRERSFYVSDFNKRYQQIVSFFLGKEYKNNLVLVKID